MEEKDIVIIGGGPAGYVAAIRVSQLGRKATLIEDNTLMGGTCLNRGCIPLRVLMRGAEFIDIQNSARTYGVNFKETEVDLAKMMARKDTIVKTVTSGVKMLLQENGVEVINGRAKFLSPSQLEVQLREGNKTVVKAQKIIIATGAACKKVPISGGDGDKIIDTTEALELKEIPKSVLIVGGGFIGISFATIYSKLGARVAVVEQSPRILHEIDQEILSILYKELRKGKIEVYTEAQISKMQIGEHGEKNITVTIKGEETSLNAEYVLMAEEREANIDELGLDNAGVRLNDKKGIAVNKRMETNVPNIFAAGDVTMQYMWTHVAFAEGRVAAENALGKGSEIDYSIIPYWTNTFPQMACVGITEEEALARGYKVRLGKFPIAANGMATVLGQRTGLIKMIVDERYGQILGVHAIGPHAAEIIAEATLAIKLDATPEEIGLTMHTHPSISEALWETAMDVNGETIHFISQNR